MRWVLVENPAFAGREPRLLGAACHDGSPFVTVRCSCGGDLHLHESQLEAVPAGAEVATFCRGCGGPLVFPPGCLTAAFAGMREEGWIA